MTVRSGLNQGRRWIAGSSIHGCWLGHYENDKQDVVRRLVKPGMVAFDIGANAGFYTLAFSRLVGDAGRVVAFEPFAENARNVLRHLQLNAVTNACLVQAAVSREGGVAAFQAGGSNSAGKLSGAEGDYLVPTVSLDLLIGKGRLPAPDIIKMDVEGAEADVLRGASRLLEEGRASLLIALHGVVPMRDCIALVEAAGYQALSLSGDRVARDGPFVGEIFAMAPRS